MVYLVRKKYLVVAIFMTVSLIVGLCATFIYLWENKNREQVELQNQLYSLNDYIMGIAKQYDSLQAEHVLQKTVGKQAIVNVDIHLRSLQAHVKKLEEEIAFYKGIVGDNSKEGVRIKQVKAYAKRAPGNYGYQLVLTRGLQKKDSVEVNLRMKFIGELDNKKKVINFQDVTGYDTESVNFNFKHFKRIEGDIYLPHNFNPREFVIQLEFPKKRLKPIHVTYGWSQITG